MFLGSFTRSCMKLPRKKSANKVQLFQALNDQIGRKMVV